jgi:hypothetical protein
MPHRPQSQRLLRSPSSVGRCSAADPPPGPSHGLNTPRPASPGAREALSGCLARTILTSGMVVGLAATLLASAAGATQVTLRLVDQVGAGQIGAQFSIGGQSVGQNGTVPLTPGTYQLTVMPPINGLASESYLSRKDTVLVGSADTLITVSWHFADLTVRLVDQDGAPDDSVTFSVPAAGATSRDGFGETTYHLPVTVEQPGEPAYAGPDTAGYGVAVYPSINQARQGSLLSRIEPRAELDTAGLTRTFVWKRATLTVRLVDQDGTPDDSVTFSVPTAGASARDGFGETTYRLPVTVEQPGEPAYAGPDTAGYGVAVYPSINQVRQGSLLSRIEARAELDAAGLTRTFVWKRANLTVRLVDQDGTPDDGVTFSVPAAGASSRDGFGETAYHLPVTVEQPGEPAYSGPFAAGYDAAVYPSIHQTRQGSLLLRTEAKAEIGTGGLVRTFVWETARGPVVVADSAGGEVPLSAFCLPSVGCVQSGTSVTLPVSEDPAHPPTHGPYSSGYPGSLRPGPSASFAGPFTFRLLPGPVFSPDFVAIAGSNYGLRFSAPAVTSSPLRVDVVGPALMRANYRTAFDLVLENQGNVEAQAVPLWISGIPTGATVELDFPIAPPPQDAGEPDWSQAPLTLTSPGGQYLALVIPHLPPGVRTRRMYLTVPADDSTFHLTAALTPPWADGASFRTCLTDGAGITDAACAGAQLTAINSYLADTPVVEALSGIALWAKIAWQCEGAATLPAALATAEQVLDFLVQPVEQQGSLPASCGESVAPRWREARAVGVVSSIDPNDKLGEVGTLSGQQAIPYSIRFENASNASASAQRVLLVDPLDLARLDVNTVSLQAIHFGSRILVPPPGLSSFADTVDLRPTRNLLVSVGASLDRFTGVLAWSFTSLDPVTRQAIPESSVDGFLPPNNPQHEGEGRVLFTALPRGELATGSEIRNGATIKFDANPAVPTPQWVNTVDNTPPESHVLPLGAGQDSARFTVHWQAVGSADVRDFTVYAREDTGKFWPWRANTAATADTFAARRGHSYAFYSVARDSAGNVEPATPAPEAQTVALVAVEGEAPAWRLALAGAFPNPARGEIRAHFTLPGSEPARLELYDVAGRRLVRREVGALGPGPHIIALDPSRPLGPGLYFLRLAQRGRVLNARVAVIR